MIRLEIEGMSCGHCEQTVREALTSVAGVSGVISVDRHAAEAIVEGTPDLESLISAVTAKGFEARVTT